MALLINSNLTGKNNKKPMWIGIPAWDFAAARAGLSCISSVAAGESNRMRVRLEGLSQMDFNGLVGSRGSFNEIKRRYDGNLDIGRSISVRPKI